MFSTVDFPLQFPDRRMKAGPQFPVRQGLQSWCKTFVLIGIVVRFFSWELS